METNETILTRDVVVIDSHKKLGSVRALRVDCDTLAVSHYIVNNTSTGSALVLPFEKALAVGDTFMTVQNRDDFLAANDSESNRILQDGYVLLKEEVFSKTGNKLSPVTCFEFDTVHGTVTRLDLEDGTSFASDAFVFFSTEFVFVDDGAPTAADLRSSAAQTGSVQTAEKTAEYAEGENAVNEESNKYASDISNESVMQENTVEEELSVSDEEIREFLVGARLNADVESEDGEFKLPQGTILTYELIEEASQHDALLLLTINIDV